MTPDQWIAVAIVAIPAVSALGVGWLNRMAIHAIHIDVNSRLSQLVSASGRAEHAEGTLAGQLSVQDIKTLIEDAITRAAAIPPHVTPEVLASAISDRAAVVALALTSTAAEVAAQLNERSPK